MIFIPVWKQSHLFRSPARGNWLKLFFLHLFDFITHRFQSYLFFSSFFGLSDYAFSIFKALNSLQLFYLASIVICCIVITIALSSCFDLFHFHCAIVRMPSVRYYSTLRSGQPSVLPWLSWHAWITRFSLLFLGFIFSNSSSHLKRGPLYICVL